MWINDGANPGRRLGRVAPRRSVPAWLRFPCSGECRDGRVDCAGGVELAVEEGEAVGGEGGGGEEAGVDHADERAGGEHFVGVAEAGEGDVGFVFAGFAGNAQGLAGGFDLLEELGDGAQVAGDVRCEDARGALAGEDEETVEVEGHGRDDQRAQGGEEERNDVVGDFADELEGNVEVVGRSEGGSFLQARVRAKRVENAAEVGMGGRGKLDGGEEAHELAVDCQLFIVNCQLFVIRRD